MEYAFEADARFTAFRRSKVRITALVEKGYKIINRSFI